ncbi:MAG TPA: tRNA 2-thiouridine(34) synthase MnmA [Vicinamibacterales bacterium]|nr:tRNA 2-thiouridine(34) synthase MnmA [Vicinamibacterales bacterium]
MRIVVAMSGGVDSSVAAALLAEQGHDVIGVSMQLYDNSQTTESGQRAFGTCCTIDDLYDARRVAATIGIPHYIVNFESQFGEHVISNFVREYVSGRTPIPCSHCNSDLKFAELLDRAQAYDAEQLATGHYARIVRDDQGRFHLYRGADTSKDQTYFLFSLTQDQLARAAFPVGHLDKESVRAHAKRLNLHVTAKPDSQEICFVPNGDYAAFVERTAPDATQPGTIVDNEGRVLGTHSGVHRFTIGQRKGLGLSSLRLRSGQATEPLYVLEIKPDAAQVVVGSRDSLGRTALTASEVNWISGNAPDDWLRVSAQIRHRHAAAAARVRSTDLGRAEVEFEAPQTAITPGQAVVFYDGDEVLGGGWID